MTLRNDEGNVLEGWALNVSRGGLRAILEEKVALGHKFQVTLGTDDQLKRTGRVVWVQEEPDGVIVGLEFTVPSGTHKSVPPEADASDAEASDVDTSDLDTTSDVDTSDADETLKLPAQSDDD